MMRDLLRSISKDKTILFSSHILQEVAAIAPRVIIIHDSKLIADFSFDTETNRTEKLEQIFENAIKNKDMQEAVK
jgi:ABC-2 type transport system ATP-binding protein